MKVLQSNVRFDFVGFTLREESIIVTALVNIGACGAVHAVAPKRTGCLPGIVAIICLWQLLGCKKNSAYGGKLLLGGLLKHFYSVLGSRGRRSLTKMCATLGNVARVVRYNKGSGFSPCRKFVFMYSASARGISEARCICVVRKALS